MKTKIFLAHVHKNGGGDSLPKKGEMVLFQLEGEQIYIGGYHQNEWFDQETIVCTNHNNTIYWIPLSEVSPEYLYSIRGKIAEKAKENKDNNRGAAAKRILSNYFYQSSTAAGLTWTAENDRDINFAVDDIINSQKEE